MRNISRKEIIDGVRKAANYVYLVLSVDAANATSSILTKAVILLEEETWRHMKDFPDELVGKKVLLYWKDLGHVEDGTILFDNETGNTYHVLFDSDRLEQEPTHYKLLNLPD